MGGRCTEMPLITLYYCTQPSTPDTGLAGCQGHRYEERSAAEETGRSGQARGHNQNKLGKRWLSGGRHSALSRLRDGGQGFLFFKIRYSSTVPRRTWHGHGMNTSKKDKTRIRLKQVKNTTSTLRHGSVHLEVVATASCFAAV